MAGLSQTGIIFICFLPCVFAQRMFYISGTTAGMNNTCGDGFTLAPRSTEKVTLQSSGRLPQGYCEVTVGINNSQRCKRQICVQSNGTLNGLTFKFTPSPSKKSTEVRGPNYQELENGKCFDGYSLFLNISEPDNIGNNFNFHLTFRPMCNDSNSADQIAASDADSRALNTKDELERAWTLTTVYGAITGVCLAIFFLIVLFITYCYYKSYPYGNKKRESASKKEVRPKSVNEERRNMEEMKLLEPAEPVGDSSGLGLSDKDVVDLEEGTNSKKGEPEKKEEEEPEEESEEKVVVEEETAKDKTEEKKGDEYTNVDLKTPEADQSEQPASLDSD